MRDSRTHLNFDQSMRESSFEHTFANQPNPRAEVSFNPVTRRVAPLYARRETSASVFWRPVRRDSTPRPSVRPSVRGGVPSVPGRNLSLFYAPSSVRLYHQLSQVSAREGSAEEHGQCQ